MESLDLGSLFLNSLSVQIYPVWVERRTWMFVSLSGLILFNPFFPTASSNPVCVLM